MDKIININLGGRIIPINDSAYDTLKNYLDILKRHFGQEEGGDEILHDMEGRISELLQERLKRGAVAISDADVVAVKEIMGSPEEIVEESGVDENTATKNNKKNTSNNQDTSNKEDKKNHRQTAKKRLTRSTTEKVISGVCGGIGAHFNIDPAIIRVLFAFVTLFWGTGAIVYLILWAILPQEATQNLDIPRRWYRNDEQRVIGGVCGGIAAYFNIDPIWPRLIFLVPALMGMGFGIFGSYYFSFSIGGFPAIVLLYLILWISIPKAKTITEKLEMKGEKVDVKNISNAAKQPQRASQTSVHHDNVFVTLLKIGLIIIGVIILLVLVSIAIALAGALIGIGLLPDVLHPFGNFVFSTTTEKMTLFISFFVIVFVVFYLIIHFIVRIAGGKRKPMPTWWSTTLIILFVVAVFGIFSVAGSVLNDFKTHYTTTKTITLDSLTTDTLILSELPDTENYRIYIDDWDINDLEGSIRVRLRKSDDSLFHLSITRSTRGSSLEKAAERAKQIPFSFQQNSNRLYLPQDINLSQSLPYRLQKVTATIKIPAGKYIRLQHINEDWWDDDFTTKNFSYSNHNGVISIHTHSSHDFDDGDIYQMQADGSLKRMNNHDEDSD